MSKIPARSSRHQLLGRWQRYEGLAQFMYVYVNDWTLPGVLGLLCNTGPVKHDSVQVS